MDLSAQDIREAQEALRELGYEPGSPGVLDEQTVMAIVVFQWDNNSPQTGTLDEQTIEELALAEAPEQDESASEKSG